MTQMTTVVDTMTISSAKATVEGLLHQMNKKFIGRNEVLELVLGAFFNEGHVLIEDVPGVGKTTLARTVSECFDIEFQRIQFTPDLMPSDVLGVTIFDAPTGRFNFRKGPIFTNILMADEINRTSPKTQSSLLEAMEEGQVTMDGYKYELAKPFMVIATQNPIEFEGTFPLPEAQMDRFLVCVQIGYPSMPDEIMIYKKEAFKQAIEVTEKLSTSEIEVLRSFVNALTVSDAIYAYVHMLVTKTRTHPDVFYGLSPRGGIALVKMAKWMALLNGREYCTPEDVRKVAHATMAHRLVLKPEALYRGQTIESFIEEILKTTPVPKGSL